MLNRIDRPRCSRGCLDTNLPTKALVPVPDSNVTPATFRATAVDPSRRRTVAESEQRRHSYSTNILGTSRIEESTQPLADMVADILVLSDVLLERLKSFLAYGHYGDDNQS